MARFKKFIFGIIIVKIACAVTARCSFNAFILHWAFADSVGLANRFPLALRTPETCFFQVLRQDKQPYSLSL